MMIELSTTKLWGLYTYIKQLDLSLDRVSQRDWNELIAFYDKWKKPRIVEENLLRLLNEFLKNIREPRNSDQTWLKSVGIVTSKFLNRYNHAYLEYADLAQTCALLALAAEYLLKKNNPPENDEISILRISLNSINQKIGKQLPMRMRRKSQKIEHYNQNPILECYPLEQIIEEEWIL